MELKELQSVDLDLRDFATNVVKYQKFKTKSALNKFTHALKETTAASYFGFGVSYIQTKRKHSAANKKLYEYIDDAINNHVQPLTPSEADKRREFKNTFQKKDVYIPVQGVLKQMKKTPLTETFEYGVMYDDTIKVFGKDSTAAKIFMAGISFVGKKARLVSIQDIKED